MAARRPLSIAETQARKSRRPRVTMTIQNKSKQIITIHQKPPKGTDFYIGAQDIHLAPGTKHTFDKSRLWVEQVDRLKSRQKIVVLNETQPE